VIRFKLAEVMAEHAFAIGRRVEWQEVSSATGIHRSTLSKMLNTRGYNSTTDNIDSLCKFFGCRVEDLMVYVPDHEENNSP
jgi:DNA-binding Xre family transcriptional regulator